jgi:hypothetical protein
MAGRRVEKGKAHMNKAYFRTSGKPRQFGRQFRSESEIQYLLVTEEQILHSISTRAPLPEVLEGICCALDHQIGNVFTFISLREDNSDEVAPMGTNAALLGLHAFCSEGLVAGNHELVGYLEMYCCVPRSPSAREFRSIQRAACLAAIAIKLDHEGDHPRDCGLSGDQSIRGHLLEWPVPVN